MLRPHAYRLLVACLLLTAPVTARAFPCWADFQRILTGTTSAGSRAALAQFEATVRRLQSAAPSSAIAEALDKKQFNFALFELQDCGHPTLAAELETAIADYLTHGRIVRKYGAPGATTIGFIAEFENGLRAMMKPDTFKGSPAQEKAFYQLSRLLRDVRVPVTITRHQRWRDYSAQAWVDAPTMYEMREITLRRDKHLGYGYGAGPTQDNLVTLFYYLTAENDGSQENYLSLPTYHVIIDGGKTFRGNPRSDKKGLIQHLGALDPAARTRLREDLAAISPAVLENALQGLSVEQIAECGARIERLLRLIDAP